MPVLQRILNLPLLLPGFGIKLLFFAVKGYGKEYAAGIKNGLALCRKPENRGKKVKFRFRNLKKLSEDSSWNSGSISSAGCSSSGGIFRDSPKNSVIIKSKFIALSDEL